MIAHIYIRRQSLHAPGTPRDDIGQPNKTPVLTSLKAPGNGVGCGCCWTGVKLRAAAARSWRDRAGTGSDRRSGDARVRSVRCGECGISMSMSRRGTGGGPAGRACTIVLCSCAGYNSLYVCSCCGAFERQVRTERLCVEHPITEKRLPLTQTPTRSQNATTPTTARQYFSTIRAHGTKRPVALNVDRILRSNTPTQRSVKAASICFWSAT